MKCSIEVPFYHVDVHLVVTDDIIAERKKMVREFGEFEEKNVGAVCGCGDGVFALFFTPNETHGVIAHEIYHLTNGIMEYVGCVPQKGYSEEAYAYLDEWITDWVYLKMSVKKRKKMI